VGVPTRSDLGPDGGRSRIVEQVYLGTEEEVIARLTAGPGGDPSLPETEHPAPSDATRQTAQGSLAAHTTGNWPWWIRSTVKGSSGGAQQSQRHG
jgi:hypothetical protein